MQCDGSGFRLKPKHQNLDILKGKDQGSKRDIVILNAAAGIFVGGKTNSLEESIIYADESIKSGNALNKLNQLIAVK